MGTASLLACYFAEFWQNLKIKSGLPPLLEMLLDLEIPLINYFKVSIDVFHNTSPSSSPNKLLESIYPSLFITSVKKSEGVMHRRHMTMNLSSTRSENRNSKSDIRVAVLNLASHQNDTIVSCSEKVVQTCLENCKQWLNLLIDSGTERSTQSKETLYIHYSFIILPLLGLSIIFHFVSW